MKKKDGRKKNKGRAKLKVPSERDLYVLNAIREGYSLAHIGRVYKISRQCVYQIKNRWPHFSGGPKQKLTNQVEQ